MIRRGFWLMAGAVTGIYGYRRASAVGRRVSATLRPSAGPGGPPARRTARKLRPARLAREAYRFTRDVREGMDLYMSRRDPPGGSTLTTDHDAQPEDGR